MSTQSEDDWYDDRWMGDKITDEHNENWAKAVETYMAHHFIKKPEHLKFDANLVKAIVPFIHFHDPRWWGFPAKEFNSSGTKAERNLFKVIKKKVSDLQEAATQKRLEKELK